MRALGSRLGEQSADVLAHGADVLAEPLGQAHAADVQADVHVRADDRTSVEPPPMSTTSVPARRRPIPRSVSAASSSPVSSRVANP